MKNYQKICNYFLGFLLALNIAAFFAFYTTIVFNIILSYFGSEMSWKFYDFQSSYGTPIFPYTLGALIIVAGIRLMISCSPVDIEKKSWKLVSSQILITVPLIFAVISLMERWGILIGSYTVS